MREALADREGHGSGARFRRASVLAFGALLASVFAGCGGGGSADGGVRVIATYSILGDLVENVGGENVGLTTLVGPNGDAHTFEPAPSDNAELAEAEVVFENGLQFEPWLDDLYASSGSGARRVVVTEDVDPLLIVGGEHGADEEHAKEEHGHEEGGHADEEHEEYDPHVWHDPTNAVVMVEEILAVLAEADPENAEAYEKNAKEYVSELEALDADVQAQVGSIPEEHRMLYTSHDTFGYFAERYGFEVDTALASVSTETGDPSAGETAELVEEIEASGVPAIFAENVSNSSVMENIAAEAGVKLAPTLYTDALGNPGTEGSTYVRMVRYNVSTMSEALQ